MRNTYEYKENLCPDCKKLVTRAGSLTEQEFIQLKNNGVKPIIALTTLLSPVTASTHLS
jgi:hypothetical protein